MEAVFAPPGNYRSIVWRKHLWIGMKFASKTDSPICLIPQPLLSKINICKEG